MESLASNGSLPRWLEHARAACDLRVEEISWARSREWTLDGDSLRHVTGAFFAVVGATLRVRGRREPEWDQPLIDQPEIGILGFLVRERGGRTEFLVQAKPEPGNVGLVQAAPTVQATESNYRRRHGGKPTPLIERFVAPAAGTVVADSLQSEQGSRFLAKYNRNIVVRAEDEVPESDALRWFAATEVADLLLRDFQVNTDARSALVSSPWRLLANGSAPFARWQGRGGLGEALLRSYEAVDRAAVGQAARQLQALRGQPALEVARVGLSELAGWEVTDRAIQASRPGSPAVRHFAVTTTEREVARWDQPLVASAAAGDVVLLGREQKGVLRFLFRARAEIGFRECFQCGPPIQDPDDRRAPLREIADRTAALRAAAARSDVLLSAMHSDEGGRFFRSVARYALHMLPPDEPVAAGDDVAWLTLGEIARLVRRPGFFTNEARTLVSLLLAFA